MFFLFISEIIQTDNSGRGSTEVKTMTDECITDKNDAIGEWKLRIDGRTSPSAVVHAYTFVEKNGRFRWSVPKLSRQTCVLNWFIIDEIYLICV